MRSGRYIGALGCMALLGTCIATDVSAATGGDKQKSLDFGPPDPPSAATAPAEYRIGAMDKLSVFVVQLPDLPKEQQVDGAGNIHMPLVGDIHAQGLTARELEVALKQKFGERYLQAPEVQVLVTDAVGDRVTVDGAVLQPGVYPLNGNRSLLQVIALAHGLDTTAASNKVAVFRTIKGQKMAAAFDLKKIRKGDQPDPLVYGNDVVVAEGSGTKSVFSTVLQSIPAIALFSAI